MKNWMRNHKKEIIAAAVSAGITTSYFIITKDKRNKGVIRLSIELFNNSKKDSQNVYGNLSINNPKLSLKDLGKLSEIIKNNLPFISDDTSICYMNISHSETDNKMLGF